MAGPSGPRAVQGPWEEGQPEATYEAASDRENLVGIKHQLVLHPDSAGDERMLVPAMPIFTVQQSVTITSASTPREVGCSYGEQFWFRVGGASDAGVGSGPAMKHR